MKPRIRNGLHRPHRWQMLEAWGAANGVLVRPEACERARAAPPPSWCALGAVIGSRRLSSSYHPARKRTAWAGHSLYASQDDGDQPRRHPSFCIHVALEDPEGVGQPTG